MSRLYGPIHRSLQDRFDTRRLADNVEARVVLTEISPEHKAFIESRDMFFLSTIDHQGRPTVSYKGGDPGFVRVVDSKAVVFPCYDGNGMFYSMGNLLGNQQVGMLFINFEKPHRLRLQGIASVDDNDPLLSEYAEAQLIVRVSVTEIFRNCPRYVHRYKKIQPSEFVPRQAKRRWPPGNVSMIYRRLYPRRTVLASSEKAICSREQSMKNTSVTLGAAKLKLHG
jgi:predicted pyridoxine 5'-phosphate oxidase superfamily flavin-nucleotide-binding protein